jgi:hypothetical protein
MYFPRPYPDEPTLSLLIRAARHLGLSMSDIFREVLGIQTRYASFARPFCLSALSNLTQIAPSELIQRHTFFPYVAAFLSSAQRYAMWSNILTDRPVTFVSFNFLEGTARQNHFFLKYCTKCAEDDLQRYGETYWHREHLLPGVCICMIHMQILDSTSVPIGQSYSSSLDRLPSDCQGTAVSQLAERQLLDRIAIGSKILLDGTTIPIHVLLQRYQLLVDLLGRRSATSAAVARRVFSELASFYGSAFLFATNFEMPRSKSIILQRANTYICLNRGFAFNSFKHLLLNIYLDHLLSF